MQAQELRTLNPKPPNPKSQLLDTPYARSRARHHQVGGKGAPMSVAGPGSAADTCSCPMKRFSWGAGLLAFVRTHGVRQGSNLCLGYMRYRIIAQKQPPQEFLPLRGFLVFRCLRLCWCCATCMKRKEANSRNESLLKKNQALE